MSAVERLDRDLVARVRETLADERAVPSPGRVAAAVREAGIVLGDVGLLDVVDAMQAALSGSGPLTSLLADPAVTDVLVNGSSGVWVDRGAGLERADVDLGDVGQVRRLAVRLAGLAGRRLDESKQ
jgi:pilus assembly protein CpaF